MTGNLPVVQRELNGGLFPKVAPWLAIEYREQDTSIFFFPEKNQLIGLSYTCPKQNISVEAEYSFLGTSR